MQRCGRLQMYLFWSLTDLLDNILYSYAVDIVESADPADDIKYNQLSKQTNRKNAEIKGFMAYISKCFVKGESFPG